MTEAPLPGEDLRDSALRRGGEGRMITGVCAGLGHRAGIDPTLLRVGFGVLVVGSGFGFFLYAAAFLLMRMPDGGPGYIEQWTRRLFDAETVLALLAAVFAFGVVINLAGGIGSGAVVVGTLLAVSLLTAHARGVDLLGALRSIPDGLKRGRAMAGPPQSVFDQPQFTQAQFTQPAAGPPPRPTAATPTGYRRLADLAREARVSAYASGEPFAPHGPYAREQPVPPPQPPAVTGPSCGPAKPKKAKVAKPPSFIGGLTICTALIVGGIMVAVQSGAGPLNPPVIGGAVLVTIGAGLLIATWFGRGAGLIVTGVIVSLALVAASTVGVPRKVGSFNWHPTEVARAAKTYTLDIGEGRLDLSDLDLAGGSRTRFDASVSVGMLVVIVPPDVRVELFAHTKLGDVKVDHKVMDGTDVRYDTVLQPIIAPDGDVAVIELHAKAGIGDLEVRRAA